ncbi:hypothetical protein, partial [Acetivibrio sp. MSJd-27]|uniref:hypothetical protein n=1 Tax=Acetivibrio sp. MSJd-27 TaxID=2841523 RepID=UPI001C0FFDB4
AGLRLEFLPCFCYIEKAGSKNTPCQPILPLFGLYTKLEADPKKKRRSLHRCNFTVTKAFSILHKPTSS